MNKILTITSFTVGIVALFFSFAYLNEKEIGHLIPSLFASIVFITMGFMGLTVTRINKQIGQTNKATLNDSKSIIN